MSIVLPIRVRPSFQEGCTSLLSLSIRGQTEESSATIPHLSEQKPHHKKLTKMITKITALSNPMKRWAMTSMQGQPRWRGHGGEFWQNTVHWRRQQQTTSVFLLREPNEQCVKAKRYDTGRCVCIYIYTPQVGRCPICYCGRAEKQLQREWRGLAKTEMALSCGCVWWWK